MKLPRKKEVSSTVALVPSTFFASLDQSQLQTYKDVFNVIDQDKDGIISDGKHSITFKICFHTSEVK